VSLTSDWVGCRMTEADQYPWSDCGRYGVVGAAKASQKRYREPSIILVSLTAVMRGGDLLAALSRLRELPMAEGGRQRKSTYACRNELTNPLACRARSRRAC
jgi:hypothetical protein